MSEPNWWRRCALNWRWWVCTPVVLLCGVWAVAAFLSGWIGHALTWFAEASYYGPSWWYAMVDWQQRGIRYKEPK